jgi:adenosine deaminase CECR1
MEYEDFGDYVHLWDKFDTIFDRVSGLITYKDAFEGFMQHMVTQMLADGVQNIEIKVEPMLALYDLAGNSYDFDYVVKFMYGLINATKLVEPQFTLKMIMSDSRHDNSTFLFPLLKLSLEYRNKYPDMVMGFDLVGPEDEGYPLIYFLEDFLEIANLSKSYEYDLPYYFHAGETLDANNTNLFDAILLGCYRIGHAFQLAKHPLLTSLVKANNIGLEICPISNQILMYIHDLRGHPAYNYFDEGLLITISPDDPAIYGYGGVSYDWYEILLGWSLDIAGLKQLAINSYIKGSFATEQERADSMAAWATKWDAWIEWVIATYPDYALPRHR